MATQAIFEPQPVTGQTEHTQPENRAYFPALDGVRALAFLLVFAHHYMRLEVGWVGVDIFFVLSGFLITGILYDTRDAAHRVRNFYVRRSLRIFPLYYLVVLAFVLAAPFAHWHWDWRWLSWPLYVGNWVLFVHRGALDRATMYLYNGWLESGRGQVYNIGHFWSLCVEEQFYLLWPWVVFKVRSRRALMSIAGVIVVFWPLLRFAANATLPKDRINADIIAHGTVFRLDTLMVGALLALWWRSEQSGAREQMFRAASRAIWIAGAVTVAALAAFAVHPALLHNKGVKPWLFSIGFTVIAIFSAILIVRSLLPGSIFFRIFRHPALRWMGRITYGAYVFHDLPHSVYSKVADALHVPTWPLALVGTFALAWLSFRFFESRFLELKDRWTACPRLTGVPVGRTLSARMALPVSAFSRSAQFAHFDAAFRWRTAGPLAGIIHSSANRRSTNHEVSSIQTRRNRPCGRPGGAGNR